ncbi:hypothetical protein [Subtercola boreus]|uniref:hypothetical protein n=1 Tax=Subtercola boreus TaxID=120213 RepID=UPI0011C067B0|nr:hypothetical protein [Subtercola boreus]
MKSNSAYGVDLILLFPDYADTTIWFMGPISYAQAKISAELAVALQEWEHSYYAGLDADFNWKSVEQRKKFQERGMELARSLSAEVGKDFTVEYRVFEEQPHHHHLTSAHTATNPSAAAAFHALADCLHSRKHPPLPL